MGMYTDPNITYATAISWAEKAYATLFDKEHAFSSGEYRLNVTQDSRGRHATCEIYLNVEYLYEGCDLSTSHIFFTWNGRAKSPVTVSFTAGDLHFPMYLLRRFMEYMEKARVEALASNAVEQY